MELGFNRVGGRWVAEFEATGDFNLHIERRKRGSLAVFQKSTEAGQYASESSWSDSAETVVNRDFKVGIAPKHIKVVSSSEPTMAIVTMEGAASGGSTGGAEDNPDDYPLFIKWTLTCEAADGTIQTETTTTDDPEMNTHFARYTQGWDLESPFSTVLAELYYIKDGKQIPYIPQDWSLSAEANNGLDMSGLISTQRKNNTIIARYNNYAAKNFGGIEHYALTVGEKTYRLYIYGL